MHTHVCAFKTHERKGEADNNINQETGYYRVLIREAKGYNERSKVKRVKGNRK